MTFLLVLLWQRRDAGGPTPGSGTISRRGWRRIPRACAWPPSTASWSIDTGRYDRSIKLFERLAKDPRGGANRFVNLALANVDKVPVSGSVRRALLGRDALDALTRAIALEPTDLAYLIRGLVNLYYDQFVFHRTDKGVADLETARRLSAAHPQVPYAPRILVALGDGYWRLNQHDKAREVWREGARVAVPRSKDSASAEPRATHRFRTSSSARSMPACGWTPRCANCFPT